MSLSVVSNFFSQNRGDSPVWRCWNGIFVAHGSYPNFFGKPGCLLIKELKLSLL